MKSSTSSPGITRRAFLQYSSAGTVVLGAGALSLRAQTAAGANERISIGLIGVGSRGAALMGEIIPLAQRHNVRITAICDVWRKNLGVAVARVKEKLGVEPRQFTRFNDLLALKDLDAVVIATPDFSHGTILTAALKAGKDVYVEKPMTIDLASANTALDLARANNRVVQTGTQRRSEGKFLGAAKLVSGGVFGPINRISAAMNVNEPRWVRSYGDCQANDVDWEAFLLHLPKRPFDARLLRQWQLSRECSNGIPGLWMTHYADAVHLLTGAQYPVRAVALGGNYVWKDGREHADTFQAALEYPEGFLFNWGMALGNSAGVHFTLHGTKGTLDMEAGTYSSAGGKGASIKLTPIPVERGVSHMENWLECLRSRQRPNADIQYGHQHTVATIMPAIALETGRRQKYDPARRTITAE
jgi:predicted dehydrogenase